MIEGTARGLRLFIGSWVAVVAIAACSSSSSGTGGGAGGHTQLADGSLGSACGQAQCQAPLTCFAGQGVPDGYCTKACASDADCGATGACFNTSAGAGCLLRCSSDAACRTGYTCQQGACAPAPATPPGGTDGGTNPPGTCIDNATLTAGWWGRNNGGSTLAQIQFNADGTAVQELSSVTTVSYNGNWTLACPTLNVTFTDGATALSFTLSNNGGYSLNDGTDTWSQCPGGAKCF